MALKGNEKIWEILEADPETRVLVFGQQPEMLMFPCNTQSYTDVEGSGGNFYISASPEAMVSFMDHAAPIMCTWEAGSCGLGPRAGGMSRP